MTAPAPGVARYGWTDASTPHSHAYLEPAIAGMLEASGARRVLDLGCGNGALSAALAARGFDVTGIDADEEGIARARARGGPFIVGSVYDPPPAHGAPGYDAVVSAEVLEHLFRPRALPDYAQAALRPGGCLIVTTPYHGYLKNLALSLTDRWDAHLDPFWDGGHIKFWSRRTLSRLLTEAGFVLTGFRGVGRWPWLWKSMIVSARKQG